MCSHRTVAPFVHTVLWPLLFAPLFTRVYDVLWSPLFTCVCGRTDVFDPVSFRPVCSASDSIYRLLQHSAEIAIGPDQMHEYSPLIAGGLLRVRLELCVVESFITESIIPFVKTNGISWILPLHETVETYVAGSLFAVTTCFILVGSTKLLAVLVTSADLFLGLPARLLGGFVFDRAQNKPITVDVGVGPFKTRLIGEGSAKDDLAKEPTKFDFKSIPPAVVPVAAASGLIKGFGAVSKGVKEFFEGTDLFVGRYLVLITTVYLAFKFVHFKIFPFPF